METAYDDAKYNRFSRKPYIDMIIPTLVDPSMAPPGKHVISCFVQYAPYDLAEGTWDERRDELYANVLRILEGHFPDIRKHILHSQVLTPLDLERIFDLPNGHVHHGEISADQVKKYMVATALTAAHGEPSAGP